MSFDPVREFQKAPQRRLILNLSNFACVLVMIAGALYLISGFGDGYTRFGSVSDLKIGILLLVVGGVVLYSIRNATMSGLLIAQEAQRLVQERFVEPPKAPPKKQNDIERVVEEFGKKDRISFAYCLEDFRSRIEQGTKNHGDGPRLYRDSLSNILPDLELRYALYVSAHGFNKDKFEEILETCFMINLCIDRSNARNLMSKIRPVREPIYPYLEGILSRPPMPLYSGQKTSPLGLDLEPQYLEAIKKDVFHTMVESEFTAKI